MQGEQVDEDVFESMESGTSVSPPEEIRVYRVSMIRNENGNGELRAIRLAGGHVPGLPSAMTRNISPQE